MVDWPGSVSDGFPVAVGAGFPQKPSGGIVMLLVILFLVLSAISQAAETGMVCKVSQTSGNTTSWQSAFRIADMPDGRSAWMTAGHGVTIGTVSLHGSDSILPGEVIAVSKSPDCALIAGQAIRVKSVFRLTERQPKQAWVSSYARGGQKHEYLAWMAGADDNSLFANGSAQQGESGAPLYDDQRADECLGLLVGWQYVPCQYGVTCRQSTRIVFERPRRIRQWLDTTCWNPANCVPAVSSYQPIATVDESVLSRLKCLEEGQSAEREALQEVARLRSELDELKRRHPERGPEGPPGKMGPQGPQGKAGPEGPAGKPCDSQIVRSLEERLRKLETIKQRVIVARDGKVLQAREYRLDEDLILDPSLFDAKR